MTSMRKRRRSRTGQITGSSVRDAFPHMNKYGYNVWLWESVLKGNILSSHMA